MPFMCEYCGEVFKREREVIYHEWRHTGTPKDAVKEVDTPTNVGGSRGEPHTHRCGCQHGGENGTPGGEKD